MYEPVWPAHSRAKTGSGAEFEPVATLKDKKSGKICHVALEEGCYVVYIPAPGLGLVPTPYLFEEVHAVLANLPTPKTQGDTTSAQI